MTDAEQLILNRMDERKFRLDCVREAIRAKERGDRTDLLTLAEDISAFADRYVKLEATAEGHVDDNKAAFHNTRKRDAT
jgi:hypothetical protein